MRQFLILGLLWAQYIAGPDPLELPVIMQLLTVSFWPWKKPIPPQSLFFMMQLSTTILRLPEQDIAGEDHLPSLPLIMQPATLPSLVEQ
jgi:hypothetical protein